MENLVIIILLHAVIILPALAIFWYVNKFPPTKINNWYGYRTPASMRNQETWDVANSFSMKWMLRAMLISAGVSIISVILLKPEHSLIVSSVFMTVLMLGIIVMTEIRLRKIFHKDGTRKEKAL